MFDVLGIGVAAVDRVLIVDQWPRPDSKIQVASETLRVGGTTASALLAASAWGAKASYAGALGTDDDSHWIIESLKRSGVDCDAVRRDPSARPLRCAIVVEGASGMRSVLYSLPPPLSSKADWPDLALMDNARALLVDSLHGAGQVKLARRARERGVAVVADLESSDFPEFEELAALADHWILSSEFAFALLGKHDPAACCDELWRGDRKMVAVTCGERGLWYRTLDGCQPMHLPGFVVEARDTTGCGDVLHGVYAAEIAQGASIAGALSLASAAAAKWATLPAARKAYPLRAQAIELRDA